jgi:hypothetical protein
MYIYYAFSPFRLSVFGRWRWPGGLCSNQENRGFPVFLPTCAHREIRKIASGLKKNPVKPKSSSPLGFLDCWICGQLILAKIGIHYSIATRDSPQNHMDLQIEPTSQINYMFSLNIAK